MGKPVMGTGVFLAVSFQLRSCSLTTNPRFSARTVGFFAVTAPRQPDSSGNGRAPGP